MSTTDRFRFRASVCFRVPAIALILGAALLACGGSGEEPDAHAHGADEGDGHEHEDGHAGERGEGDAGEHGDGAAGERGASGTDAHHLAENRADCEDDVALSDEVLARYGITVEAARELALTPRVPAPGHLAFPQSAVARVGSAVEGRVVELMVRSGASVARGDSLLVIESPELGEAQSEYLQRRTMAQTAGPALELAKRSLQRAQELHDTVQGIALSEVLRREAELRALERDLAVARAAEAAALHRLLLLGMDQQVIQELERTGVITPRFAVRAPIDGRVVEVSATLGELVNRDKDRLMVIGDARTLWAIAEVSETRLSEVKLGAAATVLVPALDGVTRVGRVAAIPTLLEAATRTAEVRIEVPNADGLMLPGMFIQVEIESSRGGGVPVLAVPDGAVLTIEGRPSVFVPLEAGSNRFCRHEIEVGPQIGTHIPVLSGLKPGELVVVAGTFFLKAEHGKASAQHEH
ncbi:MAG: efflux RND transporter periplasmic adaptor subunit [Cytophagaceae bacterium]|nr:efflux RND transporter periplasmic adaptor subunit [Gemmatimonadaceae bacterium]